MALCWCVDPSGKAGREGEENRQLVAMLQSPLPDLRETVEDQVAEDDIFGDLIGDESYRVQRDATG